MSFHKEDPLNEERSVIDNLIASSQTLMGNNEGSVSQQYNAPSEYQMAPGKTKIMMKSRRGRTSFTPTQLSDLETAFSNTHYPDFQTRKDLSNRLKIPDDRIQVWFQNRRAKWRKTQRQMSNGQVIGYHGSHSIDAVHGSQNATMMLNFQSNRDSETTERQPDNGAIGYTNARSSSTQRNPVTVKEETRDFRSTPPPPNSAGDQKPQPYQNNQEQLVNIYEKLITPQTTQELVSENQRTAPSLYSLSATVSSSGQYIILGANPHPLLPSTVHNYPAPVPPTTTPGKY